MGAHLAGDLAVQLVRVDRPVDVSRNDGLAVPRAGDGHHVHVSLVQHIGLVDLQDARPDLAFCQSKDDLVSPVLGPDKTRDRRGHRKLVTDGLPVSPLRADLIDVDDVIALGDGDLLGVGRELDGADEVRLLELLRGFGLELVLPGTSLIEHVDNLRQIMDVLCRRWPRRASCRWEPRRLQRFSACRRLEG